MCRTWEWRGEEREDIKARKGGREGRRGREKEMRREAEEEEEGCEGGRGKEERKGGNYGGRVNLVKGNLGH